MLQAKQEDLAEQKRKRGVPVQTTNVVHEPGLCAPAVQMMPNVLTPKKEPVVGEKRKLLDPALRG